MLQELVDLIRDRLLPPTMVSRSITKNIVASGSAHDAGDVLNDVAGGQWLIKNAVSENGGSGYITKAQVHTEVEAQSERIAIQVFTKPVTSTMADDAAAVSPNPTDEPYFEDEIAMPALSARGDGSYSVATPSTVGNIPIAFTCEPNSRDLFLKPITVDATTHTAGERMTIKIKIERLKTAKE